MPRLALVLAMCLVPLSPAAAHTADSDAPQAGFTDHRPAWEQFLRAQRAARIRTLRAYARSGVFPRNDDTPGLKSVLVDGADHFCAMAHLVRSTGGEALIRTVAAENNGLRFGGISDGPLMDWILVSGLTQEEAAFVQEPDFFVDLQLERQLLVQVERAEDTRLRSHFLAAADQLEVYTDTNLQIALDRLGTRLLEAPPRS